MIPVASNVGMTNLIFNFQLARQYVSFCVYFIHYLNLDVVQLNTVEFWGTITGVTRKCAA